MDGCINVGELKKLLKDIPDDIEVLSVNGATNFVFEKVFSASIFIKATDDGSLCADYIPLAPNFKEIDPDGSIFKKHSRRKKYLMIQSYSIR